MVECQAWPLDMSCCPGWEQLPVEQQTHFLQLAQDQIWMLTGRQFRICTVTVRPCRKVCSTYSPWWSGSVWTPVLDGGRWINISCGQCGGDECSCTALCSIVLDRNLGPATSIDAVYVDGELLPSTAYKLLDRNELIRVDGGCWPECQDMTADDTAPGAFTVTYSYGYAPPAGAVAAAETLACEYFKAFNGADDCSLPERVQEIVRDGITMTLLDPQEYLTQGLTGVPSVDAFIRAANPYRLAQRPRVLSPDMQRYRQVIWP